MQIKQDLHIHTEHSYDSACLKMEDLVAEAEQLGFQSYGVTDHLNTDFNLPDIINSKKNYDSIITKNPILKERFHFGVELSVVSDWELEQIQRGDYEGDLTYGIRKGGPENSKPALFINSELIKKLGLTYVIAGAHWGLYCGNEKEAIIKDYHRQCMFIACQKEVDILAHYLWWYGENNPFTEFANVPASMKQEIAAALKENNCAFEINLAGLITNSKYPEAFKMEYLEYIAEIQSIGVTLAIGSDCHSLHLPNADYYDDCSRLIKAAGIDLNRNMFSIDSKIMGKNASEMK